MLKRLSREGANGAKEAEGQGPKAVREPVLLLVREMIFSALAPFCETPAALAASANAKPPTPKVSEAGGLVWEISGLLLRAGMGIGVGM